MGEVTMTLVAWLFNTNISSISHIYIYIFIENNLFLLLSPFQLAHLFIDYLDVTGLISLINSI
jgi:hypothetical protein